MYNAPMRILGVLTCVGLLMIWASDWQRNTDLVDEERPIAPIQALKHTEKVMELIQKDVKERNKIILELSDTNAPPKQTIPPSTQSDNVWKKATTTVFWVGEDAGSDNGQIHNRSSAWDVDWETSFGGYDDPECRNGFFPCGFVPKENPFYVALPYNDLRLDGVHKVDPRLASGPRVRYESDLKNRWVEVRSGGISCFGQWQDVGPFGEDDIEYVFGVEQKPLNTRGEMAGLDVSPAMRDCLKEDGLFVAEWRLVKESEVPTGAWRKITTR